MRKASVFVVAIGMVLLASCGGATISDSCKQRINDCMRTCPATEVNRSSDRGFATPADTRPDCERRCQEICYL